MAAETAKTRQPWPDFNWIYLAPPGEIEGFVERCTVLVEKMGGEKMVEDDFAREQWRRAQLEKLADPSVREDCLFQLDVIDVLEEACEKRWPMMYESVDIAYIEQHIPRYENGKIIIDWLPSPWLERFIAWDEVNRQDWELAWPDFVIAWKSDMATLAAYREERLKAWAKITPTDLLGAPLCLITPISVGRGWLSLVREALAVLPAGAEILQIKEKFGALRVITNASSPHVRKALQPIEHRSLTVCEICGGAGHLWHDGDPGQPAGWLRTRCQEHAHTRILEVAGV